MPQLFWSKTISISTRACVWESGSAQQHESESFSDAFVVQETTPTLAFVLSAFHLCRHPYYVGAAHGLDGNPT